jgi:glycosyltransferase involved in cell wall biosynthesis
MRILHISSAVDFGGGEKHIVDLARGLAARGHEMFLALRPTNKWQSRIDSVPSEKIFHVSIRNSFGVFSAKRIGDFVRENEIDIVHAHVARDYIPASIACIAAKRAKFVLTRHVMFPLKPFNRFALKNVSRVIGVSPSLCADLENIFPKEKIAFIPNGIEILTHSNNERSRMRREFRQFHGFTNNEILIGTVGQLTPLKGQRDFVLAAAEVIKKVPSARFVIVGQDNSRERSFRRELRRLAKVMDIANKVLWLDWADDLPSLLAALDIYVSPSHSESFGIATLEAMAAGLPVVATKTDGSRELLGEPKLLVPFGDPVKLAARIVELATDENARRSLADRLSQRAFQNYSLDQMVDRVESLYRDIINR